MPTFTIPINIRMKESPKTARFHAAIEDLAKNREILVAILRQAMAETLLKEYRSRFDAKYKAMHTMDTYGKERGVGTPDNNNAERDTIQQRMLALEKSMTRLRHTKGEPNVDALADLQVEMDQLTDKLYEVDHPTDHGGVAIGHGPLNKQGLAVVGGSLAATNVYRPLMNKVRDMLTLGTNIESDITDGRITLKIGKVEDLEKIKTPSATEGGTSSPYNVMWRQLEFGTGIYAKKGPDFRSSGTYKDSSGAGGWFYGGFSAGKSRRRLHLKGTRGGHFLFREGTSLPYVGDGAKFETYFFLLLSRELYGSKAA